jgi:hypothetical protein
MLDDSVVAVGLLTARDLEVLGPTFTRVWPVDGTPYFSQLLDKIDQAEGVSEIKRPVKPG